MGFNKLTFIYEFTAEQNVRFYLITNIVIWQVQMSRPCHRILITHIANWQIHKFNFRCQCMVPHDALVGCVAWSSIWITLIVDVFLDRCLSWTGYTGKHCEKYVNWNQWSIARHRTKFTKQLSLKYKCDIHFTDSIIMTEIVFFVHHNERNRSLFVQY